MSKTRLMKTMDRGPGLESALSKTLKSLRALGLTKEVASTTDKRQRIVRLTPRGHATARGLIAIEGILGRPMRGGEEQ